jgi:hypothetical protein
LARLVRRKVAAVERESADSSPTVVLEPAHASLRTARHPILVTAFEPVPEVEPEPELVPATVAVPVVVPVSAQAAVPGPAVEPAVEPAAELGPLQNQNLDWTSRPL